MRFPRIHRIRWDKPAVEADSIDSLLTILQKGEREMHPLGDPPPDQAQAGSRRHRTGIRQGFETGAGERDSPVAA